MTKFVFALCFLSIYTSELIAQKENYNWYFGEYCGLTFLPDGKSSKVINDGKIFTKEGVATISDSSGKLLFYTDGITVYNKQHDIMSNGNDLAGNVSSTQSALIVPDLKEKSKFYIFTVDANENPIRNGLYYSIVNLNLDGGLGDIEQKNIKLFDNLTEKLACVSNKFNTGYWIISHSNDSNKYYAFELTKKGLSANPVISYIGNPKKNNNKSYPLGQIKFSPDGKKIVAAVYGNNEVEMYDFDRYTGKLSNLKIICNLNNIYPGVNLYTPYGIEFSPSGDFLYCSFDPDIAQFDLRTLTQISGNLYKCSMKIIKDFKNNWGSLQLGVDGKIYVALGYNKDSIGELLNPDSTYNSPKDIKMIYLNGAKSNLGLPSSIIKAKKDKLFEFNTNNFEICDGDSIEISVINSVNGNFKYIWSTGDTTKQIKIKNSGLYILTIQSYYDVDLIATDSFNIKVNPKPIIKIESNGIFSICSGENLQLTAISDDTLSKFLWSNGAKTKSIIVNEPNEYKVIVVNSYGCSSFSSIKINLNSSPKVNINSGSKNSICIGDNLTLTAETDNGNCTYFWSTGETTQSISINQKGKYKVVCSNSGGCKDSSEITINESIKPQIIINSKSGNLLCNKGDKIELYCSPQESDFSYKWSTNETSPNISISDSGYYQLIVNNSSGCSDTAQFRVDLTPEIETQIISNKDKICKGEITELKAEPINNKYEYLWNTGSTSPSINVSDTGVYILKVKNEFGCTKEIFKRIDLSPTIGISIDTAYSKYGKNTNLVVKITSNVSTQLSNIEIKLILNVNSFFIKQKQQNVSDITNKDNLEITLNFDVIDFTKSNEYIFNIAGKTLLSDSLSYDILIKSINLNTNEFCIEQKNGILILEEFCTHKIRKIELIPNYFSITPNPASDQITLSHSALDAESKFSPAGGGRGWTIEIYNIFGEKNLSPALSEGEGAKIKIDISNLPTGVYFIKIGDRFEKFLKI